MARSLSFPDVLFTAGGALLAVGLWLIYLPLALIAIGLLLLTLGTLGAHRWNPRE
jgi:hypothetical protein